MATLADLLRQGADKLVNLPTQAQRFVTNPQAFVQLLTGKNPLPRETGFAAGATGLSPEQGTVLDPNYQAYMQGYEQGEPISIAAMAAPAAVPVAKALAPKAGQMAEQYMVNQGFMPSLIAYHGTPHTIKGKFDISKVGTGEGAQAYGHGMYYAENPAVAKQYQAALSNPKYKVGERELKGNEAWAAQFLHSFQDDALPKRIDVDTAISKVNETLKDTATKQEIINNIKALDKSGLTVESGNLYKVDIPDEYIPNMLDWDKPLSQQPKAVQDALAKYDPDLYSPKGIDYDSSELGQIIYQRLVNDESKKARELARSGQYIEDTSGYGFQNASKRLNEINVKGIRYLDEGSRNAVQRWIARHPKGGESDFPTLEQAQAFINKYPNDKYTLIEPKPLTSNFVVFEPSDVKILEQNSKPMTRKEIIEQELEKVAK